MIFRLISTIALFLTGAFPAFAHIGHVGELVGHAHWIALGAGVIAAAAAAVIAKKQLKAKGNEQPEEGKMAEGDGEAEGAGA